MHPLHLGMATCLALSTAAQTIVVGPGGAFTDLQAAILSAPAGAVIELRGGSHGPVTVTRSLTILGVNQPAIAAPIDQLGPQPPAIDLRGSGSERFTLVGVVIAGTVGGMTNSAGPAIASAGFACVRIERSTVHAPSRDPWSVSGVANTVPAIASADLAELWLAGCDVAGAHGYSNTPFYISRVFGIDGAPAVDAPQADVVALDSTVRGADGADLYFTQAMGVPPNLFGAGGPGVVCARLWHAGSSLGGGAPGVVWVLPTSGPWAIDPTFQFAAGAPAVAANVVPVADTLQCTAAALGQPWQLQLTASPTAGLVVLGTPGAIVQGPFGWQFLDPLWLLAFALPPQATTLALPVPNAPALVGMQLAAQRLEPATGLSRPVLAVIGP